MLLRLIPCVFAAGVALSTAPAEAHPHVFVTVKSTVAYTDGKATAVRHDWRFDDMFSAFAVQGLDKNGDGSLDRAELQDLAEVNVTSLKEFEFFTFGKAGAKNVAFKPPVDYWLDHDGTALTLHFTLPIASAVPEGPLRLEIYDPSYFVAFALADTGAVALDGAPAGCRIDAEAPPDPNAAQSGGSQKLSEDFFSNLDPGSSWGKQFANVMTVRCGADAEAYAATLAATPKVEPGDGAGDAALGGGAVSERVDQALKIAEAQPLGEMAAATVQTASTDAKSPAALGAFGVVRPDGTMGETPTTGLLGWIFRQQSAFYRSMSQALTASKTDDSAFLLLAGLSFAYGVFHAAGPGHGKAVISSYLLATGETLRRGVAISFAAAMAQAVTAVVVVGVLAILLGATSQAMGVASWWLEAASYVLIAGLGFALLMRTVKGLVHAARGTSPHAAHDHECGPGCGHSHAPAPEELAGEFDWRQAASAVLAVGLRPCTGALLILVFALAQGLIWTGVAATFAMAIGTALTVTTIATLAVGAKGLAVRLASGRSGGATAIAVRGVEVIAGFVVLAFGLALLGGLLATGTPSVAG